MDAAEANKKLKGKTVLMNSNPTDTWFPIDSQRLQFEIRIKIGTDG